MGRVVGNGLVVIMFAFYSSNRSLFDHKGRYDLATNGNVVKS